MLQRIRAKLLGSFLLNFSLFILFPFSLIMGFLYYNDARTYKETAFQSNRLVSVQVQGETQRLLNKAVQLADSILLNDSVVDFFSRPYRAGTDLQYYVSDIISFLNVRRGVLDDLGLQLFLENDSIPKGYGLIYAIDPIQDDPQIAKFYRDVKQENESLWLAGPYLNMNSELFRAAPDRYYYLRPILFHGKKQGLLMISIPFSTFSSLDGQMSLDATVTGEAEAASGPRMLISESGQHIIYNTGKTQADESYLLSLLESGIGPKRAGAVAYRNIREKDWPFTLTVLTDMPPQTWTRWILTFFSLLLCASLVFFLAFNRRLLRDFKDCLEQLNLCVNRQFEGLVRVDRRDEIHELAQTMNLILARSRTLAEVNVAQGKMASKAQLLALQQQINPHFIYNTMELFSARMEAAGLYEESAAVASFCRILRYTINNDKMLVPLRLELEQIDHYLQLQKLSGKVFSFKTEIDASLLDLEIIKFILQPPIENCFKFMPSDREGEICLHIEETGDFIRVCIKDNGLGMTNDAICQLNQRLREEPISDSLSGGDEVHIGLSNISRRLRLFYGDDCRVQVSMSGGRMHVHFRLRRQLCSTEGETEI